MNIIDRFERFAGDFELCVADDQWQRLAEYFSEDACYQNLGGPDPQCRGRDAILRYFESDVRNTDRRFDSRTLVGLSGPIAEGNKLSRGWRCTYTLRDAPDLVLEGTSRYVFDGELIKELEVELSDDSIEKLGRWMAKYGARLQDQGELPR